MTAEPDDLTCPKCGGSGAKRLISRFVRGRSDDDRVDELADRVELMGEPDSPSAMRDLVREMGKAMEEDMADEMEELYEADLSGEAVDEDL
jgi:hypothetical protein